MHVRSDELPLFHVVGFTGHRHVTDPAAIERTLQETLGGLRHDDAVDWLALSSVAAGSDMLFARVALSLGFGWEAVLPLPAAEFRKDFEDKDWLEVEALLAKAEHVRVIGEQLPREDAYLDAGTETVNQCDLLLAVWDGEASRGRGGTAEIVAYARELRRPMILLDPRTQTVTRENFENLRSGDRHMTQLNGLAAVDLPADDGNDAERLRVLAFHLKVDRAATQSAPHLRKLISSTVGLHVLATALAAATVTFNLHHVGMPWSKLVCLLGALGIAVVVRHHYHQHNWVRSRLAAEITRSALASWGLPRAVRLFDDFDWVGLEPLRRSLDVLHRRSAKRCPAAFGDFKERYLRDRIDAQLAYFARQERKAVPQLARLRLSFTCASVLAIVFTALYAAHSVLPHSVAPGWVKSWIFGFGPIVLPVLAAGFISLISINDLHRRVARYKEMRVRLEHARKELTFVKTWGALERVVAKAERALLQEVFEWHSITSFAETH